MVRQWQQLFYDRRYSFTSLANPDFAMVARAYNIPARTISKPEELEQALIEMAEAKGSYMLEVEVLNMENVFPMVPSGASLSKQIYNE